MYALVTAKLLVKGLHRVFVHSVRFLLPQFCLRTVCKEMYNKEGPYLLLTKELRI
jgi:hypothetical protein